MREKKGAMKRKERDREEEASKTTAAPAETKRERTCTQNKHHSAIHTTGRFEHSSLVQTRGSDKERQDAAKTVRDNPGKIESLSCLESIHTRSEKGSDVQNIAEEHKSEGRMHDISSR